MLGLGQPSLWFLLLFALVPLIINLIQRFRLKKLVYSSLFFLSELKRETFSYFKLREILLLLLRTFFIFFLMLSLTKPYILKKTGLGQAWANRVIILDDSYSMSYGETFLHAKEFARSLITELKKTSKCALITSSGRVKTELTNNLLELIKVIDTISVSHSHATLQSAFENAVNMSNGENVEIYIITDLQARALAPVVKYSQNIAQQIPITIINTRQAISEENVGIVNLDLSPSLISPDIPSKPKVILKNYSLKNQQRKLVLTIAEKSTATNFQTNENRIELNVELKPKETKEVIFDREIFVPGHYQLKAEAESDSLPADDTYYFAFSITEKVPLLLLYENEFDIYYIERALRQGNFNITTNSFKTLSKLNLKPYKTIGLFSPSNLSVTDWQRLSHFRRQGGGLFISFANQINQKRWVEILGFDTLFTKLAEGEFQSSAGGFWTIGQIDTSSPIFEVFSKNDLSSAKFFGYYEPKEQFFNKTNKDNILAWFSTGSPFLIMPQEKCIVALTKFDINTTDFMFKASFLPLIHRIFSYLTAEQVKPSYFVGDTIYFTAQTDFKINNKIVTDKPGFLTYDNYIFAVNVFPDEGDLSAIDVKVLQDAKFKVITDPKEKITDLSLVAFFLAILFFLLELLILVL